MNEQQLWRYIDGECEQPEADRIEAALLADPSLKTLYESLVELDARWRRHFKSQQRSPLLRTRSSGPKRSGSTGDARMN